MKSYFTLFSVVASLLLLSCGAGNNPRIKTDLEAENIRGMVRSIEQNGSRTEYNRQGYVTDVYNIARTEGESDVITAQTLYDESGVVPLEQIYYIYYNGSTTPTLNRTVITPEQHAQRGKAEKGAKYNKVGNPTLRRYYIDPSEVNYKYYQDRPKYVSEYFYDEQDRLIELHSSRYGPKVEGNEIDANIYLRLDTNISRYKYNEQGDISENVTTLENGNTISHTYKYLYDEHNNWIEMKADKRDKATRVIKYYEE